MGFFINLQWIPGHMEIPNNEKNDFMTKLRQTLSNTKIISISFNLIKNQISQSILNKWKEKWKNTSFKNIEYLKFKILPGQRNIKHLFKMIKKKILFFIIMQLKIGHEYFKSYQYKLSNWLQNHKIDDDLCFKCHEKKTPSHLLLYCKKFEKEIDHMKKQFPHVINF